MLRYKLSRFWRRYGQLTLYALGLTCILALAVVGGRSASGETDTRAAHSIGVPLLAVAAFSILTAEKMKEGD